MLRTPFRTFVKPSILVHGYLGSFIQTAEYQIPVRHENTINVYSQTSRLIPKNSSPLLEVEKDLYTKLDPDGSKRKLLDVDYEQCLRQGDIVKVQNTDKSSFVGILLGINRRQLASSILLRTKIGTTAVENRISVFNPKVESIKIIRVPVRRWHRNKIYFIRGKSRLDVGDVDADLRKAERRKAK